MFCGLGGFVYTSRMMLLTDLSLTQHMSNIPDVEIVPISYKKYPKQGEGSACDLFSSSDVISPMNYDIFHVLNIIRIIYESISKIGKAIQI